jgi:hypothetical protein
MTESNPLPTKDVPEVATLLTVEDLDGLPLEHRAFTRHSVECCRPIAARSLDGDGQPQGLWLLADIMDVSKGGLCLLASDEHRFAVGQWLLLDLRSHPHFGRLRAEAQLRWFVKAHFALTFGVAFRHRLAEVPMLAMERRTERRDPNLEEWALEEV